MAETYYTYNVTAGLFDSEFLHLQTYEALFILSENQRWMQVKVSSVPLKSVPGAVPDAHLRKKCTIRCAVKG